MSYLKLGRRVQIKCCLLSEFQHNIGLNSGCPTPDSTLLSLAQMLCPTLLVLIKFISSSWAHSPVSLTVRYDHKIQFYQRQVKSGILGLAHRNLVCASFPFQGKLKSYLLKMAGGGGSGMNWEFGVSRCKLLHL